MSQTTPSLNDSKPTSGVAKSFFKSLLSLVTRIGGLIVKGIVKLFKELAKRPRIFTEGFAFIGTLATIFSTYIAYIAYFDDHQQLSSSGAARFKEAAAQLVAPKGFSIQKSDLGQIEDNEDFATGSHVAVLFSDQNIPAFIKTKGNLWKDIPCINGDNFEFCMDRGSHKQIPGSNCSLWYYNFALDSENKPIYYFRNTCTESS